MRPYLKKIFSPIREFFLLMKGINEAIREDSVEVLTLQYLEMENAFLSLVFGGLVGLPLVPLGVAMELAPLIKEEVKIMERKHQQGPDVISDFFSTLGGEW